MTSATSRITQVEVWERARTKAHVEAVVAMECQPDHGAISGRGEAFRH
jgi:hypothetical protein